MTTVKPKSIEDEIDKTERQDEDNSTTSSSKEASFARMWTKTLKQVMEPITKMLVAIADHAARNPKLYVIGTIVFSLGIMIVGLATNFAEDTDDSIWTPQNARSVEHGDWIDTKSGFSKRKRSFILLVHRDGDNVLGDDGSSLAMDGVSRVFEAVDVVRNTPEYSDICTLGAYIHPITKENTCEVIGVTNYWNGSTTGFEELATSNQQVIEALSADIYPSGRSVDHEFIIGTYASDSDTNLMTSGLVYTTIVDLPPNDEAAAEAFEERALNDLEKLQDTWKSEDGNDFRLEYIAERSFEDEFTRATLKDLPLVPLVFLVMSVLCIMIFSKKDKVRSQSLLGFGAVATVLLAIMASFGLLFAIGVPFTALTQILPFIMFGVGLDDAFIIYGSYSRTDPRKDAVLRIRETMEDIGGTILLTTLTASLAFMLGLVSSVPAVRYLVMYAWPTILIDFVFQITFFVALIVIDEKRIQDNRRDCLVCCSVSTDNTTESPEENVHFADHLMRLYSDFLLKPSVKTAVLIIFPIMLGLLTYSTTQLDQRFAFTEVIPSDSYITSWYNALNEYSEESGVLPGVYFRDVDFSDVDVQQQMDDYLNDLAGSQWADSLPHEFWLWDFRQFVAEENLHSLTFNDQIKAFLDVPLFSDVHGKNMVLDEEGTLVASRTNMIFTNVDLEDVSEQVDCLNDQRDITGDQPINKGRDDWAFFTFAEDYYIWEFYRVSPSELALSTILGTVAVSVLSLLFIPHWQAILYVGPMVAVLYMDVLGFVQLMGIYINPVTYVAMVMSIGLMVDYVMHVTLRFMEIDGADREAKTRETLETIGSSVMIGAFSTIIGVLPLAFSSSEIFFTVFVVFFGLVFFGCLHGLVLLPVVLSLIGPLEGINEIVDTSTSEPKRVEQAESDEWM